MFSRKGVFKLKAGELDLEELELELIDFGLEELKQDEDQVILYTEFESFGDMQKALEENSLEVDSSELVRIPSHTKDLSDEQVEDVIKLIEKMEEDDDVGSIFHNMNMDEG